jgi:hypothetical protein
MAYSQDKMLKAVAGSRGRISIIAQRVGCTRKTVYTHIENPFYARKWAEILAGETDLIAAFLVKRSELADELRQSSPFAGALRPQERWEIWNRTRERLSPRQ